MTAVGHPAPAITLNDHFGRAIDTASFKGKSNLLLLFYPLDWTPT